MMAFSKKIVSIVICLLIVFSSVGVASAQTVSPAATGTTVNAENQDEQPLSDPSEYPSVEPSVEPSAEPSASDSMDPGAQPSEEPSTEPSVQPSMEPSTEPSAQPSTEPGSVPSAEPGSDENSPAQNFEILDTSFTFTLINNDTELSVQKYNGTDTTVTIPSEVNGLPVVAMAAGAFYNSTVTTVNFPSSIRNIYGEMINNFPTCLQAINVDAANTVYSSSGGVLFSKLQGTLLFYPQSRPDSSYTIPNTVSKISRRAFAENMFLQNLTIAGSITTMEDYAFYSCQSLETVAFAEGTTTIGNSAFSNCSNLSSVTLPSTLKTIGSYAFSGNSSLITFTIPDGVTSIGGWAFYNCSYLTTINIPSGLSKIEESTFEFCMQITDISLPEGLTEIGKKAFYACNGFTSITIPSTVSNIRDYALTSCSNLQKAHFTGNAPSVGTNVFPSSTNGFVILYEPGKSGWTAPLWNGYSCHLYDGNGFDFQYINGNTEVEITKYYGNNTNITIPSVINGKPVTSIADSAFFGQSITSAVIPDSVTHLGSGIFSFCENLITITIGSGISSLNIPTTFSAGSNLTQINVSSSNPYFSSQNGVLFNKDGTALLEYPDGRISGTYSIPEGVTSIGAYAFYSSKGLTGITFPDSVTSIGNNAFNGSGLTSLTLPSGIETIESGTFGQCAELTSLSIPDNIKTIKGDAFYSCFKLATVNIGSGLNNFGTCVFSNCTALTQIIVDSANTAYASQDGVLFNNAKTALIQYPGGKTGNYTIPAGVTSIESQAFSQCQGLTGVTIPSGVTTIKDRAFNRCGDLTSVTIPATVNSIGGSAFLDCFKLKEAYFLGNAYEAFSFDSFFATASGFTIYYYAGTSGWTSPTWNGYPCKSFDKSVPALTGIIHSASPCTTATFYATAQGVSDPSGVASVRFAVWSEKNGQDDLKWYNGTNDGSGNWTASINAANHNNDTGVYYIHVFGTDVAGNAGLMGYTTITMDHRDSAAPTLTSITGSASPCTSPDFYFTAKGVTDDKSGVASVRFAVWSAKNGQDDLRWYEGRKTAANDWSFNTSALLHHNDTGVYYVHVFGTDNAGNTGFMGFTTITLDHRDTTAPTLSSIAGSASPCTSPDFYFTAKGVTDDKSGVASVRFAVWSANGGQDDLRWYEGRKTAANDWSFNTSALLHHNDTGVYYVHVFGTDKAGNTGFMGFTSITLDHRDSVAPTLSSVTGSASPCTTADFYVSAQGVTDDKSGVASVRFAVWSAANGQDDLKWYDGTNDGAGNWTANISVLNHHRDAGIYYIHIFGTDNAGNTGFIGYATVTSDYADIAPPTLSSVTGSASPCTTADFYVSAQGVADDKSGVASVRFAVWSAAGGQDDLKWYDGINDGSGNWTAHMNAANHKNDTGVYYIHIFGTDGYGNTGLMGYTSVTMDHRDTSAPTFTGFTGSASPCTTPDFYFTANGVTDDKSGVASVRFAVWSAAGGTDDLRWYEGRKTAANAWSFNTSAYSHKNDVGVYYIHAYATDYAGNTAILGATAIQMEHRDHTVPTLVSNSVNTVGSYGESRDIIMNFEDQTGVNSVSVAVWSNWSGQDDLYWYNAARVSGGQWKVNIPIANHGDEGDYTVHIYADDPAGNNGFSGATSFNVPYATHSMTEAKIYEYDYFASFWSMNLKCDFGVKQALYHVYGDGFDIGVSTTYGSYITNGYIYYSSIGGYAEGKRVNVDIYIEDYRGVRHYVDGYYFYL